MAIVLIRRRMFASFEHVVVTISLKAARAPDLSRSVCLPRLLQRWLLLLHQLLMGSVEDTSAVTLLKNLE